MATHCSMAAARSDASTPANRRNLSDISWSDRASSGSPRGVVGTERSRVPSRSVSVTAPSRSAGNRRLTSGSRSADQGDPRAGNDAGVVALKDCPFLAPKFCGLRVAQRMRVRVEVAAPGHPRLSRGTDVDARHEAGHDGVCGSSRARTALAGFIASVSEIHDAAATRALIVDADAIAE